MAVQLRGEIGPLHSAASGAAPSTVKRKEPLGTAGPEKVIWAVSAIDAVPYPIDNGVTVTVELGRGDTIKVELPLTAA